ncbi:YceD family protein [Prosthecobacter sp.]|uniref:YceD family protein n=1 Tax=Prosthecobacter sp. TaxID=1965333 RepID=UPI0037836E15
MHRPFFIDLRSLPENGKDISGQELPAFFDLDPKDTVKAVSPLKYDLHIERDGSDLLISGRLEATFSLECGACLERFDYRVELDDYSSEIEIAKDDTINLTDTIREDTLLALPSYPRCEDGNVRPHQCPAEGRFEPELETAPDEPQGAGLGVWEALNKLN